MIIAILALQGAFAEHQQMLHKLGTDSVLIRNLPDWQDFIGRDEPKGLIIPGGESTAMKRIMRDENLVEPIRSAIAGGLPTFGTCAGMILLSKKIEGSDAESFLGDAAMDVVVRRNAYGRQLGSFYTEDSFGDDSSAEEKVPMTFIRAPFIVEVGDSVKVLAKVDGNIVAVRQGNLLATSFHPELNDDVRVHKFFLSMI
ncbi:MAG: pyridoxal 5'-phosphate synthase glutaminase subunit PdxT [Bacteroidaceae bacterium]|nr:pyridoxal 5'-phosphate synthase glutaminase subunit PdxT [Bacteroidaceae bacterium]